MAGPEWASFTFPPLNLLNMPKHAEIVRMINEYYYQHWPTLWEEELDEQGRSFSTVD